MGRRAHRRSTHQSTLIHLRLQVKAVDETNSRMLHSGRARQKWQAPNLSASPENTSPARRVVGGVAIPADHRHSDDMRGVASVAVVGAGSTGCLVAARLAEAGLHVLLIEAGPDLRGNEPVQLRDGWGLFREHAWGYVSEPDATGSTTNVLRTKLVGGNAWLTRFALRNHPADYHRWDRLVGGGWSYPEVQEAFNAIERDLDYGPASWHGQDGPIPVTRYPEVDPTEFDAAVQRALGECQFAWVPDLNRPGAVGFGRMPMNSVGGRRGTTVDLLAKPHPNLELRPDSTAVEVVFNGRVASGVRLDDGTNIQTGIVVLTAGVYGSPCLLMRSGIGPGEYLAELGIPVRGDLPGVGRNLCDHPAVSLDLGYRGVQRPGALLQTLAIFASPCAGENGGPDLALWSSDPEGDPAEGWLDVVNLRPNARGSVSLTSSDPSEQPRISLPTPTQEDVLALCHGVHRALDLLTTTSLQSIRNHPSEALPEESEHLATWVRANAYSVPHTVGTCSMGASPANGAVVDSTGRVHGVDGLYVADASILPGPPTGFPHLVAVMMASRITDGIPAH
jgi:choline dehydrogenase